ncbi:MAG: DUF3592 domain-containing protein [Planctomycetes bacterium]|nr:DUF3592 domain-containing protein [Planctomycetota bacterium]
MSDPQDPEAHPPTAPQDQVDVRPTGEQTSPQSKPMPVWVLLFILIPIVFFLIGAINLYYDYDVVKRYVETEGKVLDTRIDKYWSRSGKGGNRRRYRPIIEYQYTVQGKTYHGERYDRARISSSSRSYAMNVLAKYPKGSVCKVYYDPDAPESSVLVKKISILFIIFAVAGGVLTLALGGWILFQFIKSRTGQAQPFDGPAGGASVGGAPY